MVVKITKKARATAKNSGKKIVIRTTLKKTRTRRAKARGAKLASQNIRKVFKSVVKNTVLSRGTKLDLMGPAPYEETYGSGARIAVTLCLPGIGRSASAAVNRVLLGQSSSMTYDAVARSGLIWEGTNCHPILSTSHSTASIPMQLCLMFSKFVFRKCRIEYEPIWGTSNNLCLAMGCVTQDQEKIPEEVTVNQIRSLQKSMFVPIHEKGTLICVDDKDMNRPAARLYDTVPGVAIGNYPNQFDVIAAVDTNSGSTDQPGYLTLHAIIDLYQLRGASQTVSLIGQDFKPLHDPTLLENLRTILTSQGGVEALTALSRSLSKATTTDKKQEHKESEYVLVNSASASGAVSAAAPSLMSNAAMSQQTNYFRARN